MNTLTYGRGAPEWRLFRWAARAWRRMGWRHVLLALALSVARHLMGPLGGMLFAPFELPPGIDPYVDYLNGRWMVGTIPIVYAVLVADEAFDDGVPALRAYGLTLVAVAALVPVIRWYAEGLMGWPRGWGAPKMLLGALSLLFQGGLAISIYAYWRVTQRSTRRAQAAQTERVRNEQRVQAANLLALQSRVEPQMLFDALGRIGALHPRDPQAADTLLADLIALLRAMMPGPKTDHSTVEREFALVDAWLNVTGDAAAGTARVRLHMAPEAGPLGIAPMLVLPLLRTVLTAPDVRGCQWGLDARLSGDRLLVTLRADDAHDTEAAAALIAGVDLSTLRDRLTQLFGRFAHLTASARPPALTLDLPRLQEDPDDDGPDR